MICVIVSRSLAEKIELLLKAIPELRPEIELLYVQPQGRSIYEVNLDYIAKIVRELPRRPEVIVVPHTVTDRVTILNGVMVVPLKNFADILPLAYCIHDGSCRDLREGQSVREVETKLIGYKHVCEEIVYKCASRLSKIRGFVGINFRRALTGLPPLILAEIIDATRRSLDDVKKIAEHYICEGADGIDIGCVAGHSRPDRVREIAYMLRREFPDILISVDTLSLQEIEAALPHVDLILSLTPSRLRECNIDLTDRGVVIIPDVLREDLVIEGFKLAIDEATRRRFTPLFDPLLRPPVFGLAHSIYMYCKVRQELPNVPLFMGLGNVTELIDADSTGTNAVMAVLSVELEVDIVLTTEAGVKTRGCVRELRTALYMATVAKLLGKNPKDMSVSLLVAKSKY